MSCCCFFAWSFLIPCNVAPSPARHWNCSANVTSALRCLCLLRWNSLWCLMELRLQDSWHPFLFSGQTLSFLVGLFIFSPRVSFFLLNHLSPTLCAAAEEADLLACEEVQWWERASSGAWKGDWAGAGLEILLPEAAAPSVRTGKWKQWVQLTHLTQGLQAPTLWSVEHWSVTLQSALYVRGSASMDFPSPYHVVL